MSTVDPRRKTQFNGSMSPMAPVRFLFAIVVVGLSLILPYRLRIAFFSFIAGVIHSPFWLFGRIARYILVKTETDNPYRGTDDKSQRPL
ncbi:MAG: hypothetical protein J0L82_15695 [Deltaproteobacteria bacterium]|jgi:hypothetical protein|nr:hypothetical protein [Deltaproteobacteria bacterium]